MIDDLIAYLLTDIPLTALVGTRIRPLARPQGEALPSVTVQKISGAPLYSDEGLVGLSNTRVQIDCWAETYSAAARASDAVETCLSALVDTVQGSTTFVYVTLEDERDYRETSPEYVFRASKDFDIWYR